MAQAVQPQADVARAIAQVTEALRQLSPQHIQSIVDYVEYLRWQEEDEDEWAEPLDPATEAETTRFRAGDISGLRTLEEVRKELAELP